MTYHLRRNAIAIVAFIAAILIALFVVTSVAHAGISSSSGSRSSSPSSSSRPSSSSGSRPSSSPSKATPSSPGGSGRTSTPTRPSTGSKPAPPVTRVLPPLPRPGVATRPPVGLRTPLGRNAARDNAFLRSSAGARYRDPYNRSYYGYANSPFHYWYLWALFHNPVCDPHNQNDDPDCPPSPQHYQERSGGCNSVALLPLGLFGGGPAGAPVVHVVGGVSSSRRSRPTTRRRASHG